MQQVVASGAGTATIYYKIAAGADTAPTIAAITSGLIAAQLAEFSGNSATPSDKVGSSVAPPPGTATFGAADTASGELLIVVGADTRSVARATNDTWTSNHATVTQAGNNNGTSSLNHYSFGYALATTSNSGANTVTLTASITTSVTGFAIAAATFKLGAQVFTQNFTPTCSPTAALGPKRTSKLLTATKSSSGFLNRATAHGGFVATLSSSGAFAAARKYLRNFAATLFPASGSSFPSSGLTAYYKLDEVSGTRADSVGSNNLTDHNSGLGLAGKVGNAYHCVASIPNYLSCADNAAFQMGTGNFTMALWVKFTSTNLMNFSAYGTAFPLSSYRIGATGGKPFIGMNGVSVTDNLHGTINDGNYHLLILDADRTGQIASIFTLITVLRHLPTPVVHLVQ